MLKYARSILLAACLFVAAVAVAQGNKRGHVKPEDMKVDMDNPTFVPMVKVSKTLYEGDSIQYVELNNIYVSEEPVFKNEKQRQAYNRLVYNVKKVLPIAKEVNKIIVETGAYLETLPNEKARKEHMKRVEGWIKASQEDKEFGGSGFKANLGVAAKAYKEFATPELRQLLDQSGLGNHPEMIRLFYRIGQKVSQDTGVTGAGAPEPKRRMFPNSNMNL